MEHEIDPGRIHHGWDNGLEPTLRISPGDVVNYDLLMAGHGQVREGDTFEQTSFDFDTLYNLLGPLYVEGAHAGDTLKIEILELTPGDWGWCVQLPELGTLPDEFPDPYLRTFDLRGGTHIEFAPGVRIPFAPFLGTMGTHPDEPATAPAFPPHKGGGNVDTRHLTAGTTLWLPVWCEGGLFSCGDPHAAQGDGEVCVAALECDMRASLRVSVEPAHDHRAVLPHRRGADAQGRRPRPPGRDGHRTGPDGRHAQVSAGDGRVDRRRARAHQTGRVHAVQPGRRSQDPRGRRRRDVERRIHPAAFSFRRVRSPS